MENLKESPSDVTGASMHPIVLPPFLAGCGVEYVHWLPVIEYRSTLRPKQKPEIPSECRFATPMLAVLDEQKNLKAGNPGNGPGPRTSGCLIRVRKALLRNSIETWESLLGVTKQQFRKWRNYGETSHRELVSIAAANGYTIAGWR